MLPSELRDAAERVADQARRAKLAELGAPQFGIAHDDDAWQCQECGDTTEPPKSADWWFSQRVECRCTVAAAEQARTDYLRDALPRWRAHSWEKRSIPALFAGCTFDGFERRRGTEKAHDAAVKYADALPLGRDYGVALSGSGLLFVGPVGSGKTHLATATLHRIHDRCNGCVELVWWSALELLDAARRGGFDNSLLHDVSRVPLLMLDDLGQGGTDAWSRDRIAQLVDARYTSRRPTIVTSNCGSADLARVYGAAIASRLGEMCQVVALNAIDYRTRRRSE